MAGEARKGIDDINKSSFGCSCNSLGALIKTLACFPYDLGKFGAAIELQKAQHLKSLATLAEQCKTWAQGGNYAPGSAVFCLLTKGQLDAKRVLEENGFEELGRTISSHLWPYDMQKFKQNGLDAAEVIYLMGKGFYHVGKDEEPNAH